MKRIEIKKWLLDVGLTQRQIAREADVSEAMVSMVLSGLRRGDKVQRVLRSHGCPLALIEDDEGAQAV